MSDKFCSQLCSDYQRLLGLKKEFERAFVSKDLKVSEELMKELKQTLEFLEKRFFLEAKKIMGREFLGPKAVENTFGTELALEEIPPMPFSKEDLERAKELKQFLILRVDRAPDGSPLTVMKMNELLKDKFAAESKGEIYASKTATLQSDFFTKEPACTEDVPKFSWALVSKDFIPGSKAVTYFKQIYDLLAYANDVFESASMSPEIQEAIDEFEEQKSEIWRNIKRLRANGSRHEELAKFLTDIRINQLFRPSAVEVFYDLLVYYQTNGEKLLANKQTFVRNLDSMGKVISVGSFSEKGVEIYGWVGGPDAPDGHEETGAIFSRTV